MDYHILFKDNNPIDPEEISREIMSFGSSYSKTVQKMIVATDRDEFDKALFCANSAKLLNSFLMARSGPFKGIGIDSEGNIRGPVEKLEACWGAVKNEVEAGKSNLVEWNLAPRSRTLALLSTGEMKIITGLVWKACKNLLPITMTKNSYGLVAASKILFAVFPEIVLPIDNAQWMQVFKTVDLGDVIKLMRSEILEWEARTGVQIETCAKEGVPTTLPSIYNVMAMAARD
jgi:hypothetical protein